MSATATVTTTVRGPDANVGATVTDDTSAAPRLRGGRKVGRTLYAQMGEQASDADPLIGVVDDVTLANALVVAFNETFSPEDRRYYLEGAVRV